MGASGCIEGPQARVLVPAPPDALPFVSCCLGPSSSKEESQPEPYILTTPYHYAVLSRTELPNRSVSVGLHWSQHEVFIITRKVNRGSSICSLAPLAIAFVVVRTFFMSLPYGRGARCLCERELACSCCPAPNTKPAPPLASLSALAASGVPRRSSLVVSRADITKP